MEAAITIRFVYPPIPDRSFDFCATHDDHEPDDNGHMAAGYGRTPIAALTNLLVQLESECDACPVCGDVVASYPAMVEVLETLGYIVCEDCHEGALDQWAEDNGQFGVGA